MKEATKRKMDIPLLFTILLSAFLNGYNIWTEHYVNTYYTTAVASMLQSFHNFFYGSLDSAGFVTVDKPPVTFWIQTAFAYIFGLHGWSVILPQALAGIGSVLLVFALVKPTFGVMAARWSALAMACTPVAVAVSRTNNIDSMLVFTLLLGTWLLFKGVKLNKIGYLIAAFATIGVAFNMKMMQAFMVLPAFYLFYWIASSLNWKRKITALSGATAVLIVISLSWAVIVDSIPKSERPYIGSSQTNSVLELALGYNGISRLTGNQGKGGMPNDGQGPIQGSTGDIDWRSRNASGNGDGFHAGNGNPTPNGGGSVQPGDGDVPNFGSEPGGPQGFGGNGGAGQPPGFNGKRGLGGGGMFGTGTPGPLRLFQSELSGQASWFIPFALFASISLLAGLRIRKLTDKNREALFWLAWLVPVMAFFSVAGFFHQYYLIMLAPPLAALVGAGWSEMWSSYRRRSGWKSWLFPAAIAITSVFQWYIIHPYDNKIGSGWSIGILVAGILISIVMILIKAREQKWVRSTAIASLLLLLVGPLYWAATPIVYGQNSMLPQAGPSSQMGMGGMEGNQNLDATALAYLKEHNTGETYLFATTDYNTAAPYIIESGEKIIILGGFSGSDPVLSLEQLKNLVASGKLKYFVISGGGMGGGRDGSSELTTWIKENGKEIPSAEWQSNTANSNDEFIPGGRGGMALYEMTLSTEGGGSK